MNTPLPKEVPVSKIATVAVPGALKDKARETVGRLLVEARRVFGRPFPMPTISFDLRGRTAGKAYLRKNHVQLNAVLFLENTQAFLDNTIAHELAHLVTDWVYGEKASAHGEQWKSVMRALGAEPHRTHSFDVTNARTMRVVLFVCKCREHEFSARRHTSWKRGATYRCKECGTHLKPKLVASRPVVAEVLDVSAKAPVTPPTERQLDYARAIAVKKRLVLPPEVLGCRQALSNWIALNK